MVHHFIPLSISCESLRTSVQHWRGEIYMKFETNWWERDEFLSEFWNKNYRVSIPFLLTDGKILISEKGDIWSRHPKELFLSIITAVHRFSMFPASTIACCTLEFVIFRGKNTFSLSNLRFLRVLIVYITIKLQFEISLHIYVVEPASQASGHLSNFKKHYLKWKFNHRF